AVMVALPIVRVMGWFGMKLLPVTVTLVPTGPEPGLRVRAGVVTVNVAVGAFVVAFVPSLAVTVVLPADAPLGTVKEQLTLPLEGAVEQIGAPVRAAAAVSPLTKAL